MSDRPSTWPSAINQLLPHALFNLATKYPNLTYAEYPHEDIAHGYWKISFREFANAVHACAWWIEATIGKPQEDNGSETLVYLGPHDVRYPVLVLGSVLVGYKMLFPSPRYGADAITRLIDSANADIMLTPTTPLPVVAGTTSKRKMLTYTIPTVDELLQATPAPYPYTKTFAQHSHEPLVLLHTSGTTGHPKPIPWTHAWASSCAATCFLPTPEGYTRLEVFGPKTRFVSMFPAFHTSGILGGIINPICTGTTTVYAPSAATPDLAVIQLSAALNVLGEENRTTFIGAGPPHLDFLASPAGALLLDQISKQVETLMWAGGDLSRASGNTVAAKVDLWAMIGTTESGTWPVIRKQRSKEETPQQQTDEEWHYLTFHPAANIRFELSSGTAGTCDALYEAVMVKNDGIQWNGWIQPAFHIHSEKKEFRLDDLFVQHPWDKQKWKHAGRADEMLILATGENFHPGEAERRIGAHHGVAEVMFVGMKRPKGAIIVRLKDGAIVDDVWRTVEEVNKSIPVYARVERATILVVTKPFLKTEKGGIQKKGMLELYGKELDALYANAS